MGIIDEGEGHGIWDPRYSSPFDLNKKLDGVNYSLLFTYLGMVDGDCVYVMVCFGSSFF